MEEDKKVIDVLGSQIEMYYLSHQKRLYWDTLYVKYNGITFPTASGSKSRRWRKWNYVCWEPSFDKWFEKSPKGKFSFLTYKQYLARSAKNPDLVIFAVIDNDKVKI